MNLRKQFINSQSPVPIFQQIVEEIERQILVGELNEGTFLISIREFASLHLVNPNTVAKAYQLLQTLELVEPIRGMGLRVKKINSKKTSVRVDELLNAKVDELLSLGKSLGVSPNELAKLIKGRENK